MTTPTLLSILQTPNMLEIDGLHAFDYSITDEQLKIEAVEGRDRKIWKFTIAQVEAATFDAQLQSWVLANDDGDHRLVYIDAFTPNNNDDDVEENTESV